MKHRPHARAAAGFSLTELMITVAILLIIAAIAVPNYRGHVLRSHRSDAMAALVRIAGAQEKFYLQNNTYTTEMGAAGLGIDDDSANDFYTLTVASADNAGFVAEARPRGGQTADTQCVYYSLDEQNRKVARDDGGADTTDLCWR